MIAPETIECIKGQIQLGTPEANAGLEPRSRAKSLEISLEGRESCMLDAFSKFVQSSSHAIGGICGSPSTPPIHFERWTVLSSPHVHKTARTQFERRTHSRLLHVYNLHPDLIPKLIWYLRQHAPPDVKVDFSSHHYIPVPDITLNC